MSNISRDIFNYDKYTKQKNKLYSYLGSNLVSEFMKYNVLVAGGAITSIFTNSEINDIDVYFKSYDDLREFAIQNLQGNFIISHTNKATMYKYLPGENREIKIQLIHYREFKDASELFNSFDFTVCMGLYDFEKQKFILHDDFLLDNASKSLVFNKNTDYPLISAIRTHKYEQRGYSISKPEYFKILLTCMALDIRSYDELKDHIGGMYGVDYNALFNEVKDKEFDIDTAIQIINDVSLIGDFESEWKQSDKTMNEILEDLDKGVKDIAIINDIQYRLKDDKLVYHHGDLNSINREIDVEEYFNNRKFYKFVKPYYGKLYSFFDDSFEYPIGEEVEPKVKGNGMLYFNNKSDINHSTYYSSKEKVLIEVEIKACNVVEITNTEVRVSKAKVIREVAEEEWIDWIELEEFMNF